MALYFRKEKETLKGILIASGIEYYKKVGLF